MRVLFTIQPLVGHFHAMVPLARALQQEGHAVAFATGESFGPVVERAGFTHFACGLDLQGSPDLFEQRPEWQAVDPGVPPGGIRQIHGFILGAGPQMVDDLIRLFGRWQPDVIIRDPVEFGGYIAAELHGLPYASLMWAIYITPKYGCVAPLAALRARYGLPEDPDLASFERYLVLTGMPRSWRFEGGPEPVTQHFRMPPFDRTHGEELPDWISTLPDQPTLYATLGTTFNQSPQTFQALIDALSSEPVNVILTVGRTMDPAQFRAPEHIRIARYIPQTLVLPHCDALLFHGGYNSLMAALWHGLPVVILPLGAGDQQPTGQQCAEQGLGVLVEGTPPAPADILAAVQAVLTNPAYCARAQQLQREIQALPDLAEAVPLLETLARTRQPVS
ncbi:MAG: glycosyltransferase family 1 protein [Anaerolineae bacterium]|nr:glycosyltransferase family 1 protein [Anaerolineae bacterium]